MKKTIQGGTYMKRTLTVLLLMVLLLLAGCSTEKEQELLPPDGVQVEYQEQARPLRYQGTEISFRSIWEVEAPQARVLLEAADLFEEKTGAVVKILWPGDEHATPETNPEIDIFQMRAADFQDVAVEYSLDLTEMAAAADYDAKSHETLRRQIIDQCGFLGAIAQVPYLGGVYYNTEIFEQCGIAETPRSWEEFLTICQLLRENGWQPLTMDSNDALNATELHLRGSLGAEKVAYLMSDSGNWDNDRGAIAALDQIMLFVLEENMAYATPAEHPAGQNKMALSNSAMMIGTDADCADVEEATLIDLDWGIFPYPGSACSGTWMTADVLMIHADSKNPQAAFDFIMLLVSGEFDQLRADICCGIPADPANASPITGAMDAIAAAEPVPLGLLERKQAETAVRLWSGLYLQASSCASALERKK